jgi:acarbose 7IV-phosphotransferase
MTGGAASRDVDVLVIGGLGVDTVAYPPSTWHWDVAPEGTLAEVQDVVAHAGGYAARGYAALGYRTAVLGHVGADRHGSWVRETLAGDGVLLDGCVTSGRTAHSVNVVDAAGLRRNFYDPRLTGVEPPDASRTQHLLERSRIAHVSIPDWARRVLQPARERGVTLVVDVQDAPGPEDEYRRDFVAAADLLFVSGSSLADPEGYARWAISAGPARLVVVGLGADGCLLVPRQGATRTFPPALLPADPTTGLEPPVVDTNGAGDSLAVGVASALLLDGRPLQQAVERGLLCARWCCTLRGTSDALLSRAQADAGQP